MKSRERIIAELFERYTWALATVTQFAAKLAEVPEEAAYEFEWSTKVVEASAEARVMAEVISVVWRRENTDNEVTAEMIRDTVMETMLRMAQSPARSTSPMANLVETAKLSAWAKLAQFCN